MRWASSASLVHSAAQLVGTAIVVVVVIVGSSASLRDAEPIQILDGSRGKLSDHTKTRHGETSQRAFRDAWKQRAASLGSRAWDQAMHRSRGWQSPRSSASATSSS